MRTILPMLIAFPLVTMAYRWLHRRCHWPEDGSIPRFATWKNGVFSMLLGVGMYAAITVFRANWDKFWEWLHVWAFVYSSGIAIVLVVLAALVFLFCAAYVIAKGIKKGWS